MFVPLPHARLDIPLRFSRRWAGTSLRGALLAAIALAALVGLLTGISEVARQAVRQGELRREATSRHWAATWRCKAIRNTSLREACLRELDRQSPRQGGPT